MKIKLSLLVIFSLRIAYAQEKISVPEITAPELLQHIRFLASDELKGRKTGEEGNRLAAQYIAHEFEHYGLKPAGDHGEFFQQFTFLANVHEGKDSKFSLNLRGRELNYTLNDEFNLQSISHDTSVSAPLAFVGYGITADSLDYDDYNGIDVKGKIIFILRYSPDRQNQESRFARYSPILVKIMNAREHGAVGIIFVSGPMDSEKPALMPFGNTESADAGLGVLSMRWDACDTVLHASGYNLEKLQQDMNNTKKPHSFIIDNTQAEMHTHIVREHGTSANIVGCIQGNDPRLASEILVIGAHMDHLGMGGFGSLAPDTVAVHHGADDNASGTAGLLELAQYFISHRDQLKRTILFIAFSGEELGLLGSDYYVKHPLFPLDHTIAMINMDMIGRLKDSTLVVEGMGTSPQWEDLVRKENSDSLKLKLKPDGFGPSDHSSFYAKDIPVMFFFTNLHADYHRPSDTWEKINSQGEQKVVQLVSRVVAGIANLEQKPSFTHASTSSIAAVGGDRQGIRVSLGVVPDYADEGDGVKISGTRPGSAAEKAGLQGGDIIIKFGEKSVKNIYDFTYLLGNYKPGDEVVIVVKRGNAELNLKARLEARK